MATVHRLPDDQKEFMLLFTRKIKSCQHQLTEEDLGQARVDGCIKILESLERQLDRVKGKLFSEKEHAELEETLSALLQRARGLTVGPLGSTALSAPLIQSHVGPASYQITKQQLEVFVRRGLKVPAMAKALNVSLRTVQRRLQAHNITLSDRFSNLDDDELDSHVQKAIGFNKLIGSNHIRKRLKRQGLLVQRDRVRSSVLRVDPVGVALRALRPKLQRRVYSVAAPNSVWHIDGNHKLIRWDIVIHGGIDGYSRVIVFLGAANDNLSATVLCRFSHGVSRYGLPARIRIDQGVENNQINVFMQVFRGQQCRPVIKGKSTHNQRIERAWCDVWRGATNVFYLVFSYMESKGLLDLTDDVDIWVLHYVFLPRLNQALEHFREEWNTHEMRTAGGKSPDQLFLLGMLSAANSRLLAVREMFDSNALPTFVSGDVDARTTYGRTCVRVPDRSFPLDEQERSVIQAQVDPLADSLVEGIDIYMHARILIYRMRTGLLV